MLFVFIVTNCGIVYDCSPFSMYLADYDNEISAKLIKLKDERHREFLFSYLFCNVDICKRFDFHLINDKKCVFETKVLPNRTEKAQFM